MYIIIITAILGTVFIHAFSYFRRETVKVTLWSDIAKKFDIKAVEKSDSPTFAVFTSLRMKMFKGTHHWIS